MMRLRLFLASKETDREREADRQGRVSNHNETVSVAA